MSADLFSRNDAQGNIRKLRRYKQPQTLGLTVQHAPRDPVTYAMAHSAASNGAGKHVRGGKAKRRAETVELKKFAAVLD